MATEAGRPGQDGRSRDQAMKGLQIARETRKRRKSLAPDCPNIPQSGKTKGIPHQLTQNEVEERRGIWWCGTCGTYPPLDGKPQDTLPRREVMMIRDNLESE